MDIAFKEDYYTAEEYFAKTADSNEQTELHNGRIVAMSSPSVFHQELMGSLYASIKDYIRRKNGRCRVIPALDLRISDSCVRSV